VKRDQVLKILSDHREELNRHGVKSIALFGSVARGEDSTKSDVDILVEFEPEFQIGLFAFARLRRRLCELFGMEVDLVTPDAIRIEMKEEILREAVRAA
jgi:predicted nucleotidyltransferase